MLVKIHANVNVILLQEYFNVMLGSQLLYKFEREQHADMIKESPEMPMCKVFKFGFYIIMSLFIFTV